MGKKDHLITQRQSQLKKSSQYHAKIHDEVTAGMQQAEKRADQSKLGLEVEAKPRRERRAEQRQKQGERKKWLQEQKRRAEQSVASKTELSHKQKLSAAKKDANHAYQEIKLQGQINFLRNIITTAATMHLLSTVILPAAAQMSTHSLNSRDYRPNAPKFRSMGSSNANQTRIFDVANLDGSNGYRLSPQANFSGALPGRAGESVAVVGGNVLVGSPGKTKEGSTGRVDMVYPTNQTQAAVRPLYNHSGNTGAEFTSATYGIGQNVKRIGNFDGDEYEDWLVTGRHGAAASMDIVYGTEDGYPDGLNLDTMTANDGLHVMQTDPRSNNGSPVYLQTSAATVGKFNGDDKDDVLFPGCADPADNRDVRGTDNACLLYGSSEYRENNISTVDLSKVSFDGKQATLIYPVETNYRGTEPLTTVSALGNITGNGRGAFAIGTPHAFTEGYNDCEKPQGKVSVFVGQEVPPGIIKKPDFVFLGAEPGGKTGQAITGDFNHNQDDNLDMAIGSPGMGQVDIIYGLLTAERFPGSHTLLGNLTKEQGTTVKRECPEDETGFALAPTGNFYNNDTYGGLAISAKAKVFVLASNANPPAEVELGSLPAEQGVKIIDSEGSSTFGFSVASGKIDGNDRTDLVVGDPAIQLVGIEKDPGQASVILGTESLPTEASNFECPVVVPTPPPSPLCPLPTPTPTPQGKHTPTPIPPTPAPQDKGQGSAWKTAGIALGGVLGIMFLGAAGYGMARHRARQGSYEEIGTSPTLN